MVLSSQNTPRVQRLSIKESLSMKVVDNLDNYLGFPLPEKVCHPKGMGGFGFRNLHMFNLALLGRQPKIVDKPSFTWSSINEAAKVLKDGFGWQGLNGNRKNLAMLSSPERRLTDLLNDENKRWNKDRVHAIYGNFLGDRICNLPVGDKDQTDRVVWFHNPHGFYYSKSAYSWLILKQVGFGPHRFLWKAFWKLKTLPKIRVFIWQVGHEILPTNAKIASI
ncbi:hypothetical protein Gotri_014671 [Gossypium trilobum]|uniref:Reverse transcriptase zinc-binding domain-containing protein n=1 Tax=Gossypium trilobum TaxID=34281 RepID=A0A7J9DXJ8_9ROSI|nr:hypothetical protein [Gossypium trilobum]